MAKKKLVLKKRTKADEDQESAVWDAKNDLDTLRRASEIQADRARLRSAQIIAKEEMDALKNVVSPKRKKKGK